MDTLFFMVVTAVSAVAAVLFYMAGRRRAVGIHEYGISMKGTFFLTVLISMYFAACLLLSLFFGMELSGDSGKTAVTGLLFLADLVPFLYLGRVRYASFVSRHARFTVPAVIVVVFGSAALACTGLRHPAYICLCAVFLVYNVYMCFMVVLTQCRLSCRFGRENMSGNLMRSTLVITSLSVIFVIFTAVLIQGAGQRVALMSVIIAVMLLLSLHSVQLIMNYPLIRWVEKRCRLDVKSEDTAYLAQDAQAASESLSVRLDDYFVTEKPYLSPDLSINEVALYLMTNKTTLSRVIHNCLNTNFREYVNRYRIQEAMLLYSKNMHLDMEQLARLSGFRNNSSFTNAFKLNIGKTPGAWCKDFKEKRNEIWKKEYLEGSEECLGRKEKLQG